ncbi:hypothetical protein BHE74_00013901 [Ensete ventricosum]|nr:hypothetical protein BHE74_00013901 [Ensete ventricosum]
MRNSARYCLGTLRMTGEGENICSRRWSGGRVANDHSSGKGEVGNNCGSEGSNGMGGSDGLQRRLATGGSEQGTQRQQGDSDREERGGREMVEAAAAWQGGGRCDCDYGGEEITAAAGNDDGGRVTTAVGEDFGCGYDCWSRRSVVVRGWSSGRGLQAAREAAVGRRLRQWVAVAAVGDGRDVWRGGATGSRWGDDNNRQRHECAVAARSRGDAVMHRGEEWLAAAIEESNAAVKKAGWKLLGSGRGHAAAAVGKGEGKSNVAVIQRSLCLQLDPSKLSIRKRERGLLGFESGQRRGGLSRSNVSKDGEGGCRDRWGVIEEDKARIAIDDTRLILYGAKDKGSFKAHAPYLIEAFNGRTKAIQLTEAKLGLEGLSMGQEDTEADTLEEYATVLPFELS